MSFIEPITRLLEEKDLAEQFSGVVQIQQSDKVIFQGAYGFANRSWKVKNTLNTRFRIASISKLFTAAAVLQLIDRGLLRLDTCIGDWLSLQGTTISPQITIQHLLTMTAGIADWFDESGDWAANWQSLCRRHPIYLLRNNRDYLPLFANETPLTKPGERHAYNGASYILLGLVIENVSGSEFFDFIRENIFAPAGMERSDFLALEDAAEEVAEGYIPLLDDRDNIHGWKKNIYSTTPEAAADGGASSTAADLIRFSRRLRDGCLLSPGLTQEMITPQVAQMEARVRGYTWKYGFGNMFILDDGGRIVRWGHTGEEEGVSCRLYYYPGPDLDVVILGNQSGCAGKLAWEIHDLLPVSE